MLCSRMVTEWTISVETLTGSKSFVLDMGGCKERVMVDSLKPAHR